MPKCRLSCVGSKSLYVGSIDSKSNTSPLRIIYSRSKGGRVCCSVNSSSETFSFQSASRRQACGTSLFDSSLSSQSKGLSKDAQVQVSLTIGQFSGGNFLVVQIVTILTALLLSPYYILTCNTLQSSRPTLLSAPVLLTVKQPRPFEINSSQCADKQVYLIHPTKQPTIRTQINLTSCYMQISTGAVHKPDRPTPFRLHVQAYNSRTSSSPITSLLVYLQKQSILLVLLFSFDAYCYRTSSTMNLLLVTSGRLVGCLFLKIYLVRNRRRRLQACCQCF